MRYKGFWRKTIPTAILALGGDAYNSDIYEWIESHIQLTHYELSESYRRHRYRHTVRGILDDMSKEGYLVKIERGHYKLP